MLTTAIVVSIIAIVVGVFEQDPLGLAFGSILISYSVAWVFAESKNRRMRFPHRDTIRDSWRSLTGQEARDEALDRVKALAPTSREQARLYDLGVKATIHGFTYEQLCIFARAVTTGVLTSRDLTDLEGTGIMIPSRYKAGDQP